MTTIPRVLPELKIEKSPNRETIEQWIMDPELGCRTISKMILEQFDEEIGHATIARYRAERKAEIRQRAEEVLRIAELDGAVGERVSWILLLRSIVAEAKRKLENKELEIKASDAIQAARVLSEKDRSEEFVIRIETSDEYEVFKKILGQVSPNAQSEFLEALKRFRDSGDAEPEQLN